MKTILYLLRHGATDANLARPALLQGRRLDLPLARVGVRQAQATRDFLGVRPIDHCYSSPLARALETAAIVAAPHGLKPQAVDDLIECDVGEWEGLDWEAIRQRDPDAYERFMMNPGDHGYPGGETLAQVHQRVATTIDKLLAAHAGQSILIVGHHVV